MSDTQALLRKIAALRQRLEQASGEHAPGSAVAARVPQRGETPRRLEALQRRVAVGTCHNALLEGSLRQLSGRGVLAGSGFALPHQLTARARRLLQRGIDLLGQLRKLADEPCLAAAFGQIFAPDTDPHPEPEPESDPLVPHFRQTVAMTDVALRTVQAFPDAASAQLRLCEGLEATLGEVARRIATITTVVAQRRRETGLVDTLADLLTELHDGKPLDIAPFTHLAEELLGDAQGGPLRFLSAQHQVARFVAGHSLTVAQVMARIVRHDAELRQRPIEPVLAALIHDGGMLRVPADIVAHPGPLSDSQQRVVEAHCRAGADMARRLLPGGGWLVEATAGHHERLDGTGYPAGLRETQIPALTRLLAVCDVYAALCLHRPHRPALDTRTALTDTLLLAEQGRLDRFQAERLLLLAFYPVGSVVELANGAVGRVVATPTGKRDLDTPARPVLELLTDSEGQPLPVPAHLDLAQCDGHPIVRSLQPAERSDLLGQWYPEMG